MNNFITTSGGKVILAVVVLIVVIGALVAKPNIVKDPAISAAGEYFDRTREDIKNYKDIKFNLIDKQENTAKVRVEFATSRTCITPQKRRTDSFKENYTTLSKGYIELSEKDINGLISMELVKSQWYGYKPNDLYISDGAPKATDWKKCYEVVTLKKYGDRWEFSGDKDEGTPLTAGEYYFFFPPKDQEKLGHKVK